jgi:uncharacterized protein YciI
MPYFALFYDTVDDFANRRLAYREAHLSRIDEAHRSGRLVLAGALKPAGEGLQPADGALLVFRTDTVHEVEQFAETDPYVTNGLVTNWRIKEWAVVIGEGAVAR